MRECLKSDGRPNLEPDPTGHVQLMGLAGLAEYVALAKPESAANAMICAINQAAYLLHRQIESQSRDFIEHGGFTERLYTTLVKARESDKSDRSDASANPTCSLCGKVMRQRTARHGANAGKSFWGCSSYPDCRGIRSTPPVPHRPTIPHHSDPSD